MGGSSGRAPRPFSGELDERLTSRSMVTNTMWNLVGQAFPLLAAIVALPLLLDGLGPARLGLLSLAWVFVGYIGAFDLGIGRAVTHALAVKLGAGESGIALGGVLRWYLALMTTVSVLTSVALVLAAPAMVGLLNLPEELRQEAVSAMRILSLALPVVITTTGLRGALEAYQRFDLAAAVRIPTMGLTVLGPVAILPLTKSLVWVVAVLVVVRLAAWVAHFWLAWRLNPSLFSGCLPGQQERAQLLRFGSWTTVSNTIAPVMAYADRFVIGAVLTASAIAFYATPYDVITRLSILPLALTGVLFPAFAATHAAEPGRAGSLMIRGTKYVFLALLPITLVVVAFPHELLALWLGESFADRASTVLVWLTLGTLINAVSQLPFAFVQGIGRPDVTAKVHLLEIVPYLALLLWLLELYGIAGAAAAWTIRVTVDAAALFILAGRFEASARPRAGVGALAIGATAVAIALLIALPLPAPTRAALLIALLASFVVSSWRLLLDADERTWLRGVRRRGAPAVS